MALHFILDGYNIIHKIPSLVDKQLETGREEFIRLVISRRPHGSSNNKVTIVFDGQSGLGLGYRNSANIKVVFSCEETADDKIKKMISGVGNKKSVIVVTDDREIQYYVKSLGAKVLGVDDFLIKLNMSGSSGKQKTCVKGKVIPVDLKDKINDEMKKIWLDD